MAKRFQDLGNPVRDEQGTRLVVRDIPQLD
jgi:hypothetical protein